MTFDSGFVKKSFDQVKREIEDSLTDSLGQVNLLPPSVFANIVSVFAERESDLWDNLEAVYNASYPNTAEGYSLDAICALNGISRLIATFSEVTTQIKAINYTTILAGTQVGVRNTNNAFELIENITISNDKCYSIEIEISNNLSDSYVVTINGTDHPYTKEDEDTKDDIALGIAVAINAGSEVVDASASNNIITITTKDITNVFSCLISENIKIVSVTNNALFRSTKAGSIAAPVGSLTEIKNPVSGWISVNNASSASLGRELETDTELRARRSESLSLTGSGTMEALRSNVLNISGVTSASITENTSETESAESLPPHSFQLLVTDGEDQDIADMIWQKKPAGIASHGNIEVEVKDSNGDTHIIKFSRPTKRFIFARINITKTTEFLDTTPDVIKSNMAEQINFLGVSTNVIRKSLFLSIFSEKGIAASDIEIGGTLDEQTAPTLAENDVEISNTETAFTDTSKIEIILEDF